MAGGGASPSVNDSPILRCILRDAEAMRAAQLSNTNLWNARRHLALLQIPSGKMSNRRRTKATLLGQAVDMGAACQNNNHQIDLRRRLAFGKAFSKTLMAAFLITSQNIESRVCSRRVLHGRGSDNLVAIREVRTPNI